MSIAVWTLHCMVGLAIWLIAGLPALAFCDQPRAITDDGMAIDGRLIGSTPGSLIWQSADGTTQSAAELRAIECPARTVAAPAGGPLRRIVLRGGERVAGVLVDLNQHAATVVIAGIGRVTIPRASLESIGRIGGLRDVLYEDRERATNGFAEIASRRSPESRNRGEPRVPAVRPEVNVERVLQRPIDRGRVQLRFQTVGSADDGSAAGLVELDFNAGPEKRELRVALGGTAGPSVEAPPGMSLATQSLRPADGWHRLVVLFEAGRLQVLIDEHVLASGPARLGRLSALRLPAHPPDAAPHQSPADTGRDGPGAVALLVDDLLVQEAAGEREPSPAHPSDADFVHLDSGDRLFGTVTRADGHAVEITGVFGTVVRNWSEVACVVLRSHEPVLREPLLSGLWARVTPQWPLETGEPGDLVLDLALQSADDESVVARHPVLGEVRWPFTDIRRIEPAFLGGRVPLTRDVYHFGDETRADFRRPEPGGRTLAGEFALESVPEGQVFLAAEVADLEPSGSDTPRGSPFLRELREGHLGTDAFVNGQRLGRLNDQLRWKSPSGDPQRVRLPIPAGLLRPGVNRWKIEQQPARDDPREFDDAELGPMAIEFEHD